jgi:hypothetical protein
MALHHRRPHRGTRRTLEDLVALVWLIQEVVRFVQSRRRERAS